MPEQRGAGVGRLHALDHSASICCSPLRAAQSTWPLTAAAQHSAATAWPPLAITHGPCKLPRQSRRTGDQSPAQLTQASSAMPEMIAGQSKPLSSAGQCRNGGCIDALAWAAYKPPHLRSAPASSVSRGWARLCAAQLKFRASTKLLILMEAAVGRPAGWRAGPCTRRLAPPARAPIAACQAPRVRLSEAGSLLLAAAGQPEWGAAAAAAASPQQGAAAAPPAAGTAPSDNTWQLVYSGSRPGASDSSSSSSSSSSGGVAALARPRRPTAAPCTAVGQPVADPRLVRLTQQLIACTSQAQVVAVLAAERLEAPDARRLLTYLAKRGATGAAVAAFRAMKTLRQPGAGARRLVCAGNACRTPHSAAF